MIGVISGLLGFPKQLATSICDEVTSSRTEAIRAWTEIREWVLAAKVKRNLQNSTIGFLGNTYNGMLDMYSDFTMVQAQTGIHIEILEMCDLDVCLQRVEPQMAAEKQKELLEMFEVSEDSLSDPLAKKPTAEQLHWACEVAAAQQLLVEEKKLELASIF